MQGGMRTSSHSYYLQLEHVVCTGSGEREVSEPRPKGQAQSNSLLSDLGKVASGTQEDERNLLISTLG